MDRIALSKRIGGLADVFASGSKMRRELEAMSYALEHMTDDKFAGILGEGIAADEVEAMRVDKPIMPAGLGMGLTPGTPPKSSALPGMTQVPRGQFEPKDPIMGFLRLEGIKPNEVPVVLQAIYTDPNIGAKAKQIGKAALVAKEADDNSTKVEGGYWNREASQAVMQNLVGDVLGKEAMEKTILLDTHRHLEEQQKPDARKKQSVPSTLTKEQTPHLSEALDSDMYKKSQGAVRKEAAEEGEPERDEKPAVKPTEEPAEEPTGEPSEQEKAVAKQKAKGKVQKAKKEVTETVEELAKVQKPEEPEAAVKPAAGTVKTASEAPANTVSFDDIQLTAGMIEVELTDEDKVRLGKLFK